MGANPNTFSNASGSFAQYWSRRMQRKHNKIDMYRDIASFEEKATLKKGQRVHRPYRSEVYVKTMGADGGYSPQALTDTDEYLDIDQEKEASFYVKELDELQHNYAIRNKYADDCAVKMQNQIDGTVLAEAANAVSNVDDGDLGGTDDNGITLTIDNVLKVLNKVAYKLNGYSISQMGRWGGISPEFLSVLTERLEGKDTKLGDEVGERGKIGFYGGNRLHLSNSVYWTGRLEVGTNPTAGDTVTVNGVTFTYAASPAAAGEVDVGGTAAVSIDNLVAAINNSEGTAASTLSALGAYYELTAANRNLLQDITATDGTTYMTIAAKGYGYIAVSETLTAAADIWTAAKQIQHNLFGQGKPIDVVIQKYPNMKTKEPHRLVGTDIVTWTAYGVKTFREGTYQLVDVKVRSDGF